jgi:hypothetical protein
VLQHGRCLSIAGVGASAWQVPQQCRCWCLSMAGAQHCRCLSMAGASQHCRCWSLSMAGVSALQVPQHSRCWCLSMAGASALQAPQHSRCWCLCMAGASALQVSIASYNRPLFCLWPLRHAVAVLFLQCVAVVSGWVIVSLSIAHMFLQAMAWHGIC